MSSTQMTAQEELIWLEGILCELMNYPNHHKQTLSQIISIIQYRIDTSYQKEKDS